MKYTAEAFLRQIIPMALFLALFFPAAGHSAQKDAVRLTADQLIYSKGNDQVSLRGNVRFYYKDTVLSGRDAVFNIKTRQGSITGGVRIYQPGTTVTGRMMTVNYLKQQAFLKGDVKIVTVRDPSAPSPAGAKEPASGITTLTCDEMEYNWVKREGSARGGVTAVQQEKRAYGDTARYSGKSEIITLEGNVRFEQGANNWVTCSEAVIDMKSETFMARGAVTGNFLVSEEKTEKSDTQGSKPSPGGTLPRTPDKIIVPPAPFLDRPVP